MTARALVQLDAGVERSAAQRADEPRRLDGRRVGEADAAAEDRRDRRARPDRRACSGTPSSAAARTAPSTAASCAAVVDTSSIPPRRSQTSSPSASTAASAPSEARGEDERSRRRRARERRRGERAPVRLEEAAVPPARPVADVLGLEHDDAQRGIAAPQRQRRPEPGVAAADDRDVRLGVAGERRRLRIGRSLVQPPRHAGQHRDSIAHMAERAFWNPMTNIGAFRERGITIVRGEGSTVWDDAGNALLDVSAALWYCNIGYGRARARRRRREADASSSPRTRPTTGSRRR